VLALSVHKARSQSWKTFRLRYYSQCDINDPCAGCPKKRPTPWRAVGCRRGTLRDALSPVVLCLIAASEAPIITLDSDEVPSKAESTLPAAKTAEDCLLESARERDTILGNMKLVEGPRHLRS
jgi:hypothetical protein